MKLDYLSKAALTAIVALLATYVFHLFSAPRAVYAQGSGSENRFYIEPGVTSSDGCGL
jgi:hypothetical protein